MLSAPIHWREGMVPVLVAEHPEMFRNMVFELSNQASGEEGSFVLSFNYEPIDCAEHLHVIRDYVALPLDDRKLQNRFQKVLQTVVQEQLAAETDKLQQEIANYLSCVILQIDYPISFSAGTYVMPLLKALKCQPFLDGDSPLERLMQYIDLYNRLMPSQCFTLINGHSFFSSRELEELYKAALHQKWRLLLLDQTFSAPLQVEDVCLIDRSLCELRLDSENSMH